MSQIKKKQIPNRVILLLIILMLSFGLNHQSLAQNLASVELTNNTKIKISADNPPVPSYLKHSKKAQQQAAKKQKKDTLGTVIIKMLKALFLIIALFLGIIALVAKNKHKFGIKSQISEEPRKKDTTNLHNPAETNIQPEKIITIDQEFRSLVFDFFNINKS